MRVVVCLKAVPRSAGKLKIAEAGDRIDSQSDLLAMNESDEYALEEAIALKKQMGCQVTVMTVGRLPAQIVLHEGLAKGADKAVRINANIGDADRTSAALAAAIQRIGADLVLTGVESIDTLGAEVGVRTAARLQFPYAFAVTAIEADGAATRIKVTKEVGGGARQVLEMPLPTLLCVQQGTRATSYVSVRSRLQAQSQPIESMTLEDLGLQDLKSKLRIIDVFRPEDTRRAELIAGTPPDVARKLFQIIRGDQ